VQFIEVSQQTIPLLRWIDAAGDQGREALAGDIERPEFVERKRNGCALWKAAGFEHGGELAAYGSQDGDEALWRWLFSHEVREIALDHSINTAQAVLVQRNGWQVSRMLLAHSSAAP